MAGCAANAVGQNRNDPPMRIHTATSWQDISHVPATHSAGTSVASISTSGGPRSVTANGIPSHLIGSFSNGGNPHAIEAQSVSLQVPLSPAPSGQITTVGNSAFGVSLEGVVFDPFAAELRQVHSSYVLRSGERPGGTEPDGTYDGAFVEDYEYVAGLGDLDQ